VGRVAVRPRLKQSAAERRHFLRGGEAAESHEAPQARDA